MRNEVLQGIWEWAVIDYHSNKKRFIVEVFAWMLSIGCSVTMAATVPNPPLMWLYIIWIMGCALYAWAAWTRNSFGMLANYLVLVGIDLVGLTRILMV